MIYTQTPSEEICVGDRVVMNGSCRVPARYENHVFTVRSSPCEVWGIICVLLDGSAGMYPVGGLDKVRR